MLATLTLPGTFCFYACVSLVGCVILYFTLPETEGRTLFEIVEHFSGGRKLHEKKEPVNIDVKFDQITVVPSIGVINNGFNDNTEIPEHILRSAAIGVKRNVNDQKKKHPTNYGSNNNDTAHDTHF